MRRLEVTAASSRGNFPISLVSRQLASPLRRSLRKSDNIRKSSQAHASVNAEAFFAPTGQKFIGDPRILFLDIETAPSLGYTWQKYDTTVIEYEKHWYILCFAYKWAGNKQTHVVSLPHFKGYKDDPEDDHDLLFALWDLMQEADVIVAHNGDRFDMRKIHARFLAKQIPPPAPYLTVDTLKLARKFFAFDSNKLDDLGQQLGLGRKLNTHGKATWLGCMKGDMKEWAKMERYNKQDIVLLEQLYARLVEWATWKPNRRKPIYAKSYK